MNVEASTTVGEIALQIAGAARVFEELRIDYCCGGNAALGDACAAAGVSLADVKSRLRDAAVSVVETPDSAWLAKPATDLVRYLERTHHVFTRAEMGRLTPLLDKVVSVHGARHPELERVKRLFTALAADLLPHLVHEELALFPAIVAGEQDGEACDLTHKLAAMGAEHEAVGRLLHELEATTRAYAVPADACGSFYALYRGLEALAADVRTHVHLENNVLFPRVAAAAVA